MLVTDCNLAKKNSRDTTPERSFVREDDTLFLLRKVIAEISQEITQETALDGEPVDISVKHVIRRFLSKYDKLTWSKLQERYGISKIAIDRKNACEEIVGLFRMKQSQCVRVERDIAYLTKNVLPYLQH